MSKRVYLYKYVYIYIYIYIYSVFIYLYASSSRVKRERGRCFLFLSLLFGLLLVTHTHARIIRSSIPPAFFFLRLLLTFFALRAARVWKSECCVSQGYMERERDGGKETKKKKTPSPHSKHLKSLYVDGCAQSTDGYYYYDDFGPALFFLFLYLSHRDVYSAVRVYAAYFFFTK